MESFKLQNEKQMRIYSRLYEIGKSLNESLEISELYSVAIDFISQDLKYEKVLIFEHNNENGWFKVVASTGYDTPQERGILKIINLLLSGEVIEYLRVSGEPITHSVSEPNAKVASLVKSLFLKEAYFELLGGDVHIPHSLIIVGNGSSENGNFTSLDKDAMTKLALGNFISQISKTMNNVIFYKAYENEKKGLEETVLKRTKELREQKNTFEAIYKTSKDGIAILDLETTAFLDVNDAYAEMTGYSKEELLKTSCLKLGLPEELEATKEAKALVVKNGFYKDFVKSCLTKDGEHIMVNMTVALMSDNQRMLVSAKDITEQKKLEQKLLQERQKAQESTKAKSEFLANMSHEIRTPMNGIIGMSHLALLSNLDKKQRNYIEKIELSAKALLGILNDILDFSKIEAGKLRIEKNEFDMFKLLDNVLHLFEYKAHEKNINIIVKHCNRVNKNFYGDSLRISQVLTNLISNAVKFTDHGEITILITKVDEKHFRFEVKDTGIGLSAEQQAKLFQSFSQADGSTTRKYGGTGLGLTISKQLIELMNGKIWVESQEGVGSSFIFELELEALGRDELSNTMVTQESQEDKKGDISTLEGLKVLLAEDNHINQEIIIGLLEHSGLKLEIVNNGQECVKKFNPQEHKLILMDLQMPLMDGYEATKIIRSKDSQVPIIALTANAMKEDEERSRDAGMNEHLNKPIDVEELYRVLLKYLGTSELSYERAERPKKSFSPSLSCINMDLGVRRVSGNEKLYKQILQDFHADYRAFHLENFTQMDSLRAMHTLKGLSATIGALRLNTLSIAFEKNPSEESYCDVERELQRVIEELSSIVNEEPQKLQRELSEQEKKSLFENFALQIATKRPSNYASVVNELEEIVLDEREMEIFQKVTKSLKKYKFSEAIELLKGI